MNIPLEMNEGLVVASSLVNLSFLRIFLLRRINMSGVQSIEDLANTPNEVPINGGISQVPIQTVYIHTDAYGNQENKKAAIFLYLSDLDLSGLCKLKYKNQTYGKNNVIGHVSFIHNSFFTFLVQKRRFFYQIWQIPYLFRKK